VVIGTHCIGSCKSNYHVIMATTAPLIRESVKEGKFKLDQSQVLVSIYYWWKSKWFIFCGETFPYQLSSRHRSVVKPHIYVEIAGMSITAHIYFVLVELYTKTILLKLIVWSFFLHLLLWSFGHTLTSNVITSSHIGSCQVTFQSSLTIQSYAR